MKSKNNLQHKEAYMMLDDDNNTENKKQWKKGWRLQGVDFRGIIMKFISDLFEKLFPYLNENIRDKTIHQHA